MAAEDIQAVHWTCDGCGKRVILEPAEGPPDGYHGTAYEAGSWGVAAAATWWACKRAHIGKAVVNALERAVEEARS